MRRKKNKEKLVAATTLALVGVRNSGTDSILRAKLGERGMKGDGGGGNFVDDEDDDDGKYGEASKGEKGASSSFSSQLLIALPWFDAANLSASSRSEVRLSLVSRGTSLSLTLGGGLNAAETFCKVKRMGQRN